MAQQQDPALAHSFSRDGDGDGDGEGSRKVHLVVLIHGLYGSPVNLAVPAEELERADRERRRRPQGGRGGGRGGSDLVDKDGPDSVEDPSSAGTPRSAARKRTLRGMGRSGTQSVQEQVGGTDDLRVPLLGDDTSRGGEGGGAASQHEDDDSWERYVDGVDDRDGDGIGYGGAEGNGGKGVPPGAGERLVVYRCSSFTGSRTWDGVDVNARRAAEEVDKEIGRLEGEGYNITRFSVMGYSLGGLVARYLVGLLHSRKPSFYGKYRPGSFSTAATPHIGVLKYGSTTNTIVHTVGRRLFSRSGQQLYCLDKDAKGRCLLEIMADPNDKFVKALQLFPRIMIVANGCHDLTVPYPTASISLHDPFLEADLHGIHVEVDHRHIVQSWRRIQPGSNSNSTSTSHADAQSHSHLQSGTSAERSPGPGAFPGGESVDVLDDGEVRVVVSTKRKITRKRPSAPPIFMLPLPYPFSHSLFLLLPFLLPIFILYAACILTWHTYQSGKRTRIHHEALEKVPLLADSPESPILQPRLAELISEHGPDALISSGTSTPLLSSDDPEDLPPSRTPLLLTPRQREMIRNLNEGLPQMERMVAWFHWVYNSHATIVVRDSKRFPFQEEGRGVVRTWAEWVLGSSSAIIPET